MFALVILCLATSSMTKIARFRAPRAPFTVQAGMVCIKGFQTGQSNISFNAYIVRDIRIELRNIMSKKIIAVVGATGRQGGGMIDVLLKDGTFAVRAITRDTGSDKAKGKSTTHQRASIIYPNFISRPALAGRGAEVVAGDLNDTNSLTRAFTGVYGVFGITDCASSLHELYYC